MVIIRPEPIQQTTPTPVQPMNSNPVPVNTPAKGGESSMVEYGDYLGLQDKGYTPVKKKGFFKSFVQGVDKEKGEESTTAGTVGNVIGSVLRVPTQKVVDAAVEFTPTRKAQRAEIEKIRQTDSKTADMIEDTTIGEKKTTGQLVTQAAAGVGELALTLVPIGLAGKAGRMAFTAAEIGAFSKLGTAGKFIAGGAKTGATFGQKVANMSAVGSAYGAMYGFLSGLEDGGDWEKAFKNAGLYAVGGGVLGAATPVAFKGVGSFFGGASKATKFAANKVSEFSPEFMKPGQYIQKLPMSLQRAIFTENYALKTNFGEVGRQFADKFTKAYRTSAKYLGEFQDEAASLGIIKAPIISRGAYKDAAPLAERWADREFRFTVRDALTHEGQFKDAAVRAELLGKDKYLDDVVKFFDKYRKDRGLRAQQAGITDNLLDVDTYFSRYTPQVPLSGKVQKQLAAATDDVEREVIYKNNSDAVDDMIEYGVRQGQWKTKAEGFKNYYDAMDAALNIGKVPDDQNAYFKWLVDNKHADSIQTAKSLYLESLDAPQKSLTSRAVSLDYERKLPMPWNDPDPMRVMSYYVKKADERLAMAEQFGVDDQVIKEMKTLIQKSNMGQNAVESFDKIVRSITGQVHRQPKEQRMSALLRGIETFHLAFSQIINATTLLNYIVTADTKSLMTGLIKTSEKQNMRDSVKRGIFVSDMIRQTTPYSNMGDNMVDKILNYSGFTYTEMFNRAAGIGVSESWAKLNFNKILASKGIQVLPEDEALVGKMLADNKKAKTMVLEKGYENTGKYAKEFASKFPNENFAPTAGNIGLAEKRLVKLEDSVVPKLEKLQKAKAFYEERMVNQGRKLTDEDVIDLQDTINILQDSIDIYKGQTQKLPGQAQQFSEGEVKEAVDGVIKLRRNQMQKMIADLEDEFDQVRATGMVESLPEADRVVLSPEQRIAKTNAKVKSIDEAIISLQNELTDKERLLTGIIDGYKIADTQVRTDFPEGFAYDKFIGEKKAALGGVPKSPEVENLKELGIDVEEALARGSLTQEELTTAAQVMVEHTQGGTNPLMLPGFMRTPWGKVFGQFKTFAYMQANFIGKETMKNIVSKDTASVAKGVKMLSILGGAYPLTYGALRDVRDIVTGKKDVEDAFELEKYWQGIGLLSAAGLYTDFIKSAGEGRLLEFAAGPTVGDVTKYLDATLGESYRALFKGEEFNPIKPLRKQILNQTGVGQVLNNIVD